MSSVNRFRDFINERLTAAAVDIFSVFEQTIVQYEREIEQHRRSLDNCCKHEKPTTASELLQHHDFKEEDEGENLLSEQQLCHHKSSSHGTGQEAELSQIKEEQQNVPTCPDGEQLAPKQENDSFTVTLTCDPSYSSERFPPRLSPASERLQEQSGHDHSESPSDAGVKSVAHTSDSHCNTDTRLITCELCGRGFKKKSAMKRHQKIHTGERSHSCKTCGKAFRDNSVLLRHMRIHTGEKPYPCKVCGKSFKDRYALMRHMKIHTNEKPYACKICGKSFKFNFKLSQHERSHTDQDSCLCNTCGKTFVDPPSLKRHMRIHMDEKPFACKTCGKSFRYNYRLLYHMKIHKNVNLPS